MFILMLLLWFLLNGKFTVELLIIGLLICLFVYLFLCKCLDFSLKKDLRIIKNLYLIIAYVFVLIIEVVKSNLNIITLILSRKKNPEPEIVHFTIDLNSEFLRVLFANSITLTPGTITVSLDDNKYTVHALRKEYIEGIENSTLLKILKKMEVK